MPAIAELVDETPGLESSSLPDRLACGLGRLFTRGFRGAAFFFAPSLTAAVAVAEVVGEMPLTLAGDFLKKNR